MYHTMELFDCFFGASQIFFLVCLFAPTLLIPFVFIFGFSARVCHQYFEVSRELKRLESINKSPTFSYFSESLNGLHIIRAFEKENIFIRNFCERIDAMNKCHIGLWIANRWLNFRMYFLGSIVAGVVGFGVIYYSNQLGTTAAGVLLVYSLSLCDYLTFLARSYAEVRISSYLIGFNLFLSREFIVFFLGHKLKCQMDLNSIERIKEYSLLTPECYFEDNELNESSAIFGIFNYFSDQRFKK